MAEDNRRTSKADRIYYLSRDRFPGERAHSINQIRMCDAFADLGKEVILVCPAHFYRLPGRLAEFYGLRNRIKEVRVPCLAIDIPLPSLLRRRKAVVRWKNRFITDLAGISTTFSILCYLVFRLLTGRIREGDIIYGRSAYFALFFTKTIFSLVGRRNRVAVELHQPPAGRFGLVRFFARKLDKAFVLTGWLKDCCQARGFQNLLVIPDGVDLNPFLALRKNTSKEHARKELNLPSDRRIICYTGHLYRSKGVESLIRCAPSFPEALFLIVGGFPENVEWCRKIALWLNADNVIFTGHLPPVQVPAYLFASDLCVYTLEPDAPFRNFTSPLKLFEYLASGNPVVAAAVPGVKEVVADGVNGLLYEPGEIEELKAKIRRILEDQDLSRRLAQNGFTTAQRYSWTRRAERVLEALE